MDESERCDYNTIKTALFKYYQVTQESYHSSMDSFKRKSEESWSTCGMRFYHLAKKLVKDCATVESLLALVSWDAIYKLMPRQMANAVKGKKPHTFEEALEMADNFATTRGWSYKLLEDAGRHSHQEDKFRRHQGRQDTQDNMETLPKLLRPKETGKSSNHGDTTWKTAPKFDRDGRPRCFKCNLFGHFAKEYHNSKKGNDQKKIVNSQYGSRDL